MKKIVFLLLFPIFFAFANDVANNPKTILITGGAGYIGSHVSYLLAKMGHKIIILDNRTIRCDHWPATFVSGDFSNQEILRKIFTDQKVDLVIHLAAFANLSVSISNPQGCYENNLVKTLTLLNTMTEFHVDQMIFSSSCSVYGPANVALIPEELPKNPRNPYGKSKLFVESILEDYAKAYGLTAISFRYFNAAGALNEEEFSPISFPENNFIANVVRLARNGQTLKIFGSDYPTKDGTCVRDYIHVVDIARAHVAAIDYLDKEGATESFNLGTGQGYSIYEIIDATQRAVKKPVSYQLLTRREGDLAQVVADISKAEKSLQWTPKYSDLETIVNSTNISLQNNP